MKNDLGSGTTIERPARASTWLWAVGTVHALVVAAFAVVMMAGAAQEAGVVVLWAMAWLAVVLLGVIAGAVAGSRDRAVTGRNDRGRWLVRGMGVFSLAHALPMILWSPWALFGALTHSGNRSEDYLASAFVGIGVWVVLAGAVGLLWRARRSSAQATGLGDGTLALLLEPVLVVAYTLPLAFIAVVGIAEAGDGGGMAWVVLPLLAGTSMLALGPLAWFGAAADMVSSRRGISQGDWASSFTGRLGVLSALVAVPMFGFALFPMWHEASGQRFGVQMVAVLVTGIAVWMAVRWRGAVGGEPVAG